MTDNAWHIYERPEAMDVVLTDGYRKAYFAVHEWLADNRPETFQKDAFQGLSQMIQRGLRPYKVVGMAISDFSKPLSIAP